MGSNMMRQAVPLLKPESPLSWNWNGVDVALDSGVTIVAKEMVLLIKLMVKEL